MPRAENRKRPPGQAGHAGGAGTRNKHMDESQAHVMQKAQDKKQELIEKVKRIQESKKTGTRPKE